MEKRSHRKAVQGMVYLTLSLSMRRVGTSVAMMAAGERGKSEMDVWWNMLLGNGRL